VRIEIPGVILAEAASETALPIEISPVERVPRNSLLRVRGMPAKAALSEGHAVGPGAWAVPIAALPRLKVVLPVGLAGKSTVTVALVTIAGEVVAETRFSLLIGAAGLIAPDSPREAGAAAEPTSPGSSPKNAPKAAAIMQAPEPMAAPPPPPPRGADPQPDPLSPPAREARPPPSAPTATQQTPPPPAPQPSGRPSLPPTAPFSAEAEARARGFLKRGEQLLKDSDVVSARLFFERAADAGLAEGATALAGTYDPHELVRVRIVGLKPDVAAARRWYERARDLGSTDAADKLARLGP
jgi:hypothetical protein